MKLGIAADHAGFEYKEALKTYLEEKGFEITDFGTDSLESSDYADFVHPLADAVGSEKLPRGIAFCGSGEGMCMTANKHPHVRAALVWNETVAEVTRQHNDANILCIPARFVDIESTKRMVDIFLSTDFDGGRHKRRIDKMDL